MNQKKINKNWEKMYELAYNYHNYYGNLEIQSNFKTLDGINEDENGVSLGCWIQTQRQAKKENVSNKITEEQIKKLEEIGMIWNIQEKKWNKMYELAKNYYNYYGNLEVRVNFKTKDGINEDENGFALGIWIETQRKAKRGNVKNKITKEQIRKLEEIGMIWNIQEEKWNKMYELAKNYYNYYGNLEVKVNFKTSDGINSDKNGFTLGSWLQTQRKAKKVQNNIKITQEEIEKLDQIGMIWSVQEENWNKMYELAKNYYNYYGNLDIKVIFKTLDGINEDENGFSLGSWLQTQRKAKKGQNKVKITEEQIERLDQIGIIWDIRKNKFDIAVLCSKYGINTNKNAFIKNKSYNEIFAKICYLNEISIPICDDQGKLHPIFFMSDINMQVEYGVSLEFLIQKYIIEKETCIQFILK